MLQFNTFLSETAFNVGHNSSDDGDIQKLILYLQGTGNSDDLVLVSNGEMSKYKIKRKFTDQHKDIKDYIKDNGLKIPFASSMFGDGSIGEGGKKVPVEVQEMMTACLVLMKYKGTTLDEKDAVELIEKAKSVYSKVDGSDRRPDFLDFFNGNFDDLATAISAANYILDEVSNPVKVYWTGKGWDKDIEKYNPKLGNIKDYNSSDIVVKDGSGKFFGYSLKKKASSKSPDPTLINKPITGKKSILADILGADMVLINNAKRIFFSRVLEKRLKLSSSDIKKMKPMEYSKAINKIPVTEWGKELKSPKNIFFRKVESVIKSHDQDFIEKFLSLVFRTELQDTLNAQEFQFTLLTGIGKFVRKQVNIENADGQELSNVVTALQDLYKSKLAVKRTSGKLGAWEKGAGAAKVFLTIYSDGSPILDIEVRYKGSYSAEPQFQAMATADFKKIFKKL
jgi:hypothetical protein|tara:strand:- start:3071 stop:4426 length:1356 start_codon:yes stop_codon:yes gene_type:complete